MELRRVAPVLGLGALLVVDGALIAWAMRPGPEQVAQAVSTSGSSASPATGSAPSPSAEGTASPSPSASPTTVPVVPVTRVVAATGDEGVWVADAGTCEKPGGLWVSDDGGDTWSVRDAPGQVLRIRPSSATDAFVTGGDAQCDLKLWTTADGARSWGGAGAATTAWSRVPDSASQVDTPTGEQVTPCSDEADVVDLAPVDATGALVLCADGRVRSTADGGNGWDDAFTVDGALALALAPDTSAGIVAASTTGCDGVEVLPVRSGSVAKKGECVESSPRRGRVSVAASGSRWWLVVGKRVFAASDPEGPWETTGSTLKTS